MNYTNKYLTYKTKYLELNNKQIQFSTRKRNQNAKQLKSYKISSCHAKYSGVIVA